MDNLLDKVKRLLGGGQQPRFITDIGKSVSSFVSNPVQSMQQGIQNFAMKNPNNAVVKWGSNVQTEQVPYMNKTFSIPKITAQTPLIQNAASAAIKYAIAPQAEMVRKGIQSYAKQVAPAVYGKPTIEDYGNMAGGYGAATNPLSSIVGGGFGAIMKGGENLLNKKPITQGMDQAYREGYTFQSKLGPISEAANIALRPILSKLNPTGMQSWNTYINLAKNPNISQAAKAKAWGLLRNAIVRQVGEKALSGFVGMGAFGATMPAKNWEERLKNTIDQGVHGAIFEGGQRIVGQGANVIGKQVLKPLMQDVGKNRKGFFAGQNALGFNDASRKFSSLADKKLRFEVSDRQSYLKRNAIEPSKERGVVQLQDIFQHEGLWRQYPEFKKLRVSFEDLGNAKGSFNENTFTLSINKNMSPSEMRSTILHEVQHAVQAREGFARGGSPQMFQDIGKSELENLIKIHNLTPNEAKIMRGLYDSSDRPDASYLRTNAKFRLPDNKNVKSFLDDLDPYGAYHRTAGEIESRDVQARMNLSPEQRKYTQPYASQGIPLKDQIVRMDGGGSSMELTPEQQAASKKLPGIMYSTSKTKAEGRAKPKTEIPPWETPEFSGKGKSIGGEPLTKQEINNMIGEAQFRSENDKKIFKDLFAKWIGQRNAAKTTGVETGAKLVVPERIKGEDVIRFMENPNVKVEKNVKEFAYKFRQEYDTLFKEANKAGIDIPYRENYITHIWEQPIEQVAQLYQQVKQKFGFAGKRSLPTYEEGIRMGLTPKYTNPAQIISEYTRRLEQTKSNIEFVNELLKKGYIVPKATAGFEPITAPGFVAPSTNLGNGTVREGVFYAPKEIAQAINRVFSEQDTGILSKTAKWSGKLQDVTMSGGLPATPINAWTSAQIIKEMTAGRIKGPLKAIFTSLYEGNSNKYFAENAQVIKEQQLNNVPISTTFNVENLAPRSVIQKIFGSKVGDIWNKTVNEPTFKRFMPILQTEFYKDVREQALKAGKTPDEAIRIAAQATKNFYGMTSTADTALRNKYASDAASTLFFAPRYRESMVNFWVKSLKAMRNPLALENRANAKFLVGAGLTLFAMDKANRFFNDGKSMSENPPGTEDKLLIPLSKITGNKNDKTVIGIPFLSSIATIPRAVFRQGIRVLKGDISGAAKDAGQTYLSMGLKPLADIAANADYYGKSITQDNMTPSERLKAQGKYLFKQYVMAHPYLKEFGSNLPIFNKFSDKSTLHDPAYQRLSRAMELPIRYYDEAQLKSKYYFGARDNAINGLSDVEKQAFNAIPKADTNDPNTRILKYQIYLTYPSVFEAKQKIELETAAKTGKAIDPLYLVNYDTAKKYMRYEALPEGSQDRKDMTKAYPELTALFDTRSKYFEANPIEGQKGSQRPMPSRYVQDQMDAKNWSDPQVRAYLDANTAWNNAQRQKLGLPPLSGFTTFAKKPKKVTLRIKKAPKVKTIKIKMAKLPKVKKIKFPKLTVTRPKRSVLRLS